MYFGGIMSSKLILLALLIAGAVYYVKHPQLFAAKPIGYAEGRMKITMPGRDFDLVLVAERTQTECEDGFLREMTNEFCERTKECSNYTFGCKQEISEKYLSMLNKEPATTHFLHVTRSEDRAKGIVLIWGLSDKEATLWCQQAYEYNRSKKPDAIQECI